MNYFGENDDFVLLKSTQIPNGFHLGNISGGHCSLSDARYVWQYIDQVRRNPNISFRTQTDRSYSGTFTQDQYRGACLLYFGMIPLTIVTGITYTYLIAAVNNSLGSAKTPSSNCYDGGSISVHLTLVVCNRTVVHGPVTMGINTIMQDLVVNMVYYANPHNILVLVGL